MLDQNLEAGKTAMETYEETDSRQRDQPVQRPWGRLVFSVFKEQKAG